ncbi:MAG: sulfotransferase [Acidobacteriota bacterium]
MYWIKLFLKQMGPLGKTASVDHEHLKRLDGVDFRPVFVLGNHRSGTTLLYQMLAASESFNVVTAYHVIEGDRLLTNHLESRETTVKKELREMLARRTAADGGKRLIDEVSVSPDLPEEYGFRLSERKIRPRNLSEFITFCKKVQYIAGDTKPLLLKNPWDFPNFLFLRQALPQARFIFIHRNPLRVMNSQIRAVRALFSARAPYHALVDPWYRRIAASPTLLAFARWALSPPLGILFREVMGTMRESAVYFMQNHKALEGAYIQVRYEDLCEDPSSTISRILGFLDMEPTQPQAYAPLVRPRRLDLLPEVEKNADQIKRLLGPYLEHCGY